jgi:MFS transporter, PAT family, beta-lactamase induction signal transducer AmpG
VVGDLGQALEVHRLPFQVGDPHPAVAGNLAGQALEVAILQLDDPHERLFVVQQPGEELRVGGIVYERLGMKLSVLVSLVLMAVSNFSFAGLAAVGHTNLGMAAAVGFENFASGIGGVTVVAYLSALCNLRFTATQYALLSALASIAGRFLTGTTVGALIEAIGYVHFYVLTTIIALPGVILFWIMIRSGLADVSIGSAGKEGA